MASTIFDEIIGNSGDLGDVCLQDTADELYSTINTISNALQAAEQAGKQGKADLAADLLTVATKLGAVAAGIAEELDHGFADAIAEMKEDRADD